MRILYFTVLHDHRWGLLNFWSSDSARSGSRTFSGRRFSFTTGKWISKYLFSKIESKFNLTKIGMFRYKSCLGPYRVGQQKYLESWSCPSWQFKNSSYWAQSQSWRVTWLCFLNTTGKEFPSPDKNREDTSQGDEWYQPCDPLFQSCLASCFDILCF